MALKKNMTKIIMAVIAASATIVGTVFSRTATINQYLYNGTSVSPDQFMELMEENKRIQEQYESTITYLKNQIQKLNDEELNAQEDESGETVVDFKNLTDILYSGMSYDKYDGQSNEGFKVGGKNYKIGFTIYNDGGIFNVSGPGYVLFNLEGKYSKMVCRVGKVNSADVNETLYITSSDGSIDMEYLVRSDVPSQLLEIPLNYVNDMKIALNTETSVMYGFYDIKFYM